MRRLLALTGLIAASAWMLFEVHLDDRASIDVGGAGIVLALPICFAVAEMCVIHVQLRTEATSFSLSEIALVLGLVWATPGQLVAARLLGGVVALVLHRRQPLRKVALNLGSFALETCVAVLVYHAVLGSADPLSLPGWAAALTAALAALAVGSVAVSLAIAASQGGWPKAVLNGFLGVGTFTTSAAATAGLLAVAALRAGEAVGWLLAVGGAGAFAAYRSHARLRQDHRSLELIHDFTRAIGEELHSASLYQTLPRELGELLRAEIVQLVLRPEDGPPVAVLWHDGRTEVLVGDVVDGVAASHRALLAGTSSALRARLRRGAVAVDLPGGARDVVVTMLQGLGTTTGSLLAGNRRGDVDTFTEADQRLMATLANHTSMVLRNADLVARLRREAADREHQALHDNLTGLGNRMLLNDVMRKALDDRGADGLVAVLLIDLDRFKEVNDTLGHHQGDVLLCEIARRLVSVVEGRALAVRLGGDEFAVIATSCRGRHEVRELAMDVEAAITAPFEVGDVTLDVGASIGIALAPDDGSEPATLLQRADVAMYAAKSGPRSVELYDPQVDHYSPWRLALASELRRTVERHELLVEYQPKADLRTGDIVGVEALARWHHPERGFISPDVFVPVAEHTGLIRALTEHVIDVSLRQCRAWRDEGHDLNVAVNLSVRNLLDDRLPTIISAHLAEKGLPASSLTVEVTEGTIMADPSRTVGILNRLSSMGVTVAIDDFGTGYSSLAYLKRLPVDELKIDRSFVASMAKDDSDLVIVRSTIDLARNLGLTVTAEGVEDGPTWQLLQALGCHRAQGYFLGRPMTAARLIGWLRERAGEQTALASLIAPEPLEGEPVAPVQVR